MESLKSWVDWIGTERLVIYLIAILLLLLFAEYLIIPILIVLTGAVALCTKALRPLRKFGVELATFTTILTGAQLGPALGGIAGFIIILSQLILGEYLDIYVLWVVPGYIILGVIAGITTGNLPQFGITATVIMNALFLIFTALFNPSGLAYYFTYTVGNIAINAFLFTTIAPGLIGFMI